MELFFPLSDPFWRVPPVNLCYFFSAQEKGDNSTEQHAEGSLTQSVCMCSANFADFCSEVNCLLAKLVCVTSFQKNSQSVSCLLCLPTSLRALGTLRDTVQSKVTQNLRWALWTLCGAPGWPLARKKRNWPHPGSAGGTVLTSGTFLARTHWFSNNLRARNDVDMNPWSPGASALTVHPQIWVVPSCSADMSVRFLQEHAHSSMAPEDSSSLV